MVVAYLIQSNANNRAQVFFFARIFNTSDICTVADPEDHARGCREQNSHWRVGRVANPPRSWSVNAFCVMVKAFS